MNCRKSVTLPPAAVDSRPSSIGPASQPTTPLGSRPPFQPTGDDSGADSVGDVVSNESVQIATTHAIPAEQPGPHSNNREHNDASASCESEETGAAAAAVAAMGGRKKKREPHQVQAIRLCAQ
eukprot:scpid100797/ scgid24219/ 